MSTLLPFKSITFQSINPGISLIILGAVHGNETCGTQGIQKIIREIESGDIIIQKGKLTLVPIANPLAYQKNERGGDRNLNRNLSPTSTPIDFEDHAANFLCPLLASHDVLLDLHSFQASGQPFAFLGPQNNEHDLEPFAFAKEEQELAIRLGVNRFVDGWLATYALGVERRKKYWGENINRQVQLNTDSRYGCGTTEYMRSTGGWALTLECGQHLDPNAPHIAYTAIKNTLLHLGLIEGELPSLIQNIEALSLYEVIDKHHNDDCFSQEFQSFDFVRKGSIIATRVDGEVITAQEDAYIVFPNPKAQTGQEWFYLAHNNNRFNWRIQ